MNELTQVLGRIEREPEAVTAAFDRHYDTTADDLWQACTEPERLARWYAPVTGDLRPGGEFTMHFDDGDVTACRVRSCDAPTRLVWEWPVRGAATLVTLEVRADGDGSRLLLRHERLTDPQAAAYAAGWDAYLRALDAHVDGSPAPDWGATWSAVHELYAAGS